MTTASRAAVFPLRLGSTEQFAQVREFLHRIAFDDQSLCRLMHMSDMSDVGNVRWDKQDLAVQTPPLDWCARVFLRGLRAKRDESIAICSKAVITAMEALGLVRAAKNDASELVCPVWLYPVDDFVVASDRRDNPDGGPVEAAADVVFPAIYAGTLRFLALLPEAQGGEALDLCGGSGIGALRLSLSAKLAATADVTKRSAFFAEFNARLNGVTMESHCGDLYAPVRGRQFDLITAHPPFVPAVGDTMIYRDAGDTGEEVTQRIVEGLPNHLRPGGMGMILCVARDTNEQTFEHRVVKWLGSAAREFDIVYGLEKVLSVEEVVDGMRKRGQNIGPEKANSLISRLRSMNTKQFVYGALFLRRCEASAPQSPFRIWLTLKGRASDFERLLEWRRFTRQPGFKAWLADSKPRLAPGLELNVRHVMNEGSLVPAEFVFSIEEAFQAALRPDAWVVPLIARLEGSRSVCKVFESAREKDELPEGFKLEDFTELVEALIGRGFLIVDFRPDAQSS